MKGLGVLLFLALASCQEKAPKAVKKECPAFLKSDQLQAIYNASLTKERLVMVENKSYWVEHVFVDPPTAAEDLELLKISFGEAYRIEHKKVTDRGCFFNIFTENYQHPRFKYFAGRFRVGNLRLVPTAKRDKNNSL